MNNYCFLNGPMKQKKDTGQDTWKLATLLERVS